MTRNCHGYQFLYTQEKCWQEQHQAKKEQFFVPLDWFPNCMVRQSQLVCNVHTLHPLVVVKYTPRFFQGDAVAVPLAGVRHLGRMHRGQHMDIFLSFKTKASNPLSVEQWPTSPLSSCTEDNSLGMSWRFFLTVSTTFVFWPCSFRYRSGLLNQLFR